MFVAWYDGRVRWWMYYMAKYYLVVWYVSGIRSVRVEYVVRISVTNLYIIKLLGLPSDHVQHELSR